MVCVRSATACFQRLSGINNREKVPSNCRTNRIYGETSWRKCRKGPEGKYGKSKAENVAITKISSAKKRQRSQQNIPLPPINSMTKQLLPQIMTEERRNEIATLGDEADILSHFTAGNDVLASQESNMTKLYDLLLKNREWNKKTQRGYSIHSCTGETAKLYLEIDELMYKVDPNSKDFIELLENVVVPKVYDHLGTLADLGRSIYETKTNGSMRALSMTRIICMPSWSKATQRMPATGTKIFKSNRNILIELLEYTKRCKYFENIDLTHVNLSANPTTIFCFA